MAMWHGDDNAPERIIGHGDIVAGKHFEFVMGDKPAIFWD
jgi:hypothetical protein